MTSFVRWLDKVLYPQFEHNWDNELFRSVILEHIEPTYNVLDLGAGAGILKQMHFRGATERVCGVDLDERVLANPHLDEARVADVERIPYDDASFDLVFCNNVLEHLDRPHTVFSEVQRVLKPGGLFLAKTPNRWHYVPLIAACTPHWFHQKVNLWRGRKVADTFPTRYQANSRRAIQHHARMAGLELREVRLFEGRPEYLRFNALLYLAGWTYERLVNHVPGLAGFRVGLITILRKPEIMADSTVATRVAA